MLDASQVSPRPSWPPRALRRNTVLDTAMVANSWRARQSRFLGEDVYRTVGMRRCLGLDILSCLRRNATSSVFSRLPCGGLVRPHAQVHFAHIVDNSVRPWTDSCTADTRDSQGWP